MRIALSAHLGQSQKNRLTTTHVASVANMATTEDEEIVGWLHDVLEDTPITATYLLNEGVSSKNVDSIYALTRHQGESYLDYILRASRNITACFVKSYDLIDNLKDLPNGTMRDKYLLAQWIIERRLRC